MLLLGNIVLTAAGSAGDAAQAAPGATEQFLGMIFPFVLMIGLFYLMVIRPQQKKDKELKKRIESLKVGDEIVTIGGIYGKIASIKDDTFIIESAPGNDKSKFKIARWAVKECLTIRDGE